MQVTIDGAGRIVVPKPLRDALGLTPGSTLDVSRYGAGLQLVPGGRTARLVEEDGELVIAAAEGSDVAFTDDDLYAAIDAGRR